MTDDRSERMRRLFAAHADAVHGYALCRVGHDLAPDVVSDTFLVAWRRIDAVPADPLPWLLGVARKVILGQQRSRGRQSALLERLAQRADAADGPDAGFEQRLVLVEAMRALSSQDQEVLVTSAWYDLTAKQAAQVLGCSSVTYAVRLHRARHRLRGELERRDPPLASAHLTREAGR